MMKTRIGTMLALAVVLLASTDITLVQAGSEELLNADFESGLPGDWSVVDGGNSVHTWFADDGGDGCWPENQSSKFMLVDSFAAGFYNMDEQLVTGTVECNDFDYISLEFEHDFMAWADEICDVDILIAPSQWQNIATYQVADACGLVKLDISTLAQERDDVQIRWHYYNANWAWHWAVDNVVIRGIRTTDDPVLRIAGYVLTASDDPIDNVTVTAYNPEATVSTDPCGYYELTVPFFWSGDVTLAKQEYYFEPDTRSYEKVTYDLDAEDYVGGPTTFVISGKVKWDDESGIEGAAINSDNGGYSDITDENGDYSLTVGFGWSGSITVSKCGYEFAADTLDFPEPGIFTNYADQDFECSSNRISGHVRDVVDPCGLPGAGIEGATLSADNGAEDITDPDGFYSVAVPDGFIGTVTPHKDGWGFDPCGITYANVTSDMPDQDYRAGDKTYTISGYLRDGTSGLPLADATVAADSGGPTAISQGNGYYEIVVPFWWAGTITVSKEMYTFTNPGNSRTYGPVYQDQNNQNYIGLRNFRISGCVKSIDEKKLAGILVASDPDVGSDTTDSDGNYDLFVLENWSGTIIAEVDPCNPTKDYGPVTADFGNQDFILGQLIDFPGSGAATIQGAIDAAEYLDCIVVSDGVYSGLGNYDLDFGGKAITLRSENGPNDCIIDPCGMGRGFHFHNGETDLSVVDGFTIRNGSATDGGGISNESSSPTITNCTFTANTAANNGGGICSNSSSSPMIMNCTFTANVANDGGGVYNDASSPEISNCAFAGNGATVLGGGVCNWNGCSPTITDCTFIANEANDGGGVYNDSSSPAITNCAFAGNDATAFAGGVCNWNSSDPNVSNCTFIANDANDGGGVYNYASSPDISNCAFTANNAEFNGGGMCNDPCSYPMITSCTFSKNEADDGGGVYNGSSSPTIINCTFYHNIAVSSGGGIYSEYFSSPTITNCTFSENEATDYGGGICDLCSYPDPCFSSTTITNCILWRNTSCWGDQISAGGYSHFTISHTDLEGGLGSISYSLGSEICDGGGNIDMDPEFVLEGDTHLIADSPCIDGGDNQSVADIPTDIDGIDRILDGDNDSIATVDMGAYEYVHNNPDPLIILPQRFFRFAARGGEEPLPQILQIKNCGGGTLNWTIQEDCDWLEVYYKEGESSDQINNVTLEPDITGMAPGKYSCMMTVSDSPASQSTSINSPVTVVVTLNVGRIIAVPDPCDDIITIQDGINAAMDSDIVVVADGVYSGMGNYYLDFGGKAITVKSENGPNGCIIDPCGMGCGFHFHNGETDLSVVDGFTIMNANDAGVYNFSSSPTITNCKFYHNSAVFHGGGVYNKNFSSPTITNCTFTENHALFNGGGIANYECSPRSPTVRFTTMMLSVMAARFGTTTLPRRLPTAPLRTTGLMTAGECIMTPLPQRSPTVRLQGTTQLLLPAGSVTGTLRTRMSATVRFQRTPLMTAVGFIMTPLPQRSATVRL